MPETQLYYKVNDTTKYSLFKCDTIQNTYAEITKGTDI